MTNRVPSHIIHEINRDDLLHAMELFRNKKDIPLRFDESKRFDILHLRERYPPKIISAMGS